MEETLHHILQEALKAWIAREIQPSWGILPLTQADSPQSTGGQQEAQARNISENSGTSQVQIPENNSTRSSTIPIQDNSCKRLTHTPVLGESHTTRVPMSPTKNNSSDFNLIENKYVPRVKCMDPV